MMLIRAIVFSLIMTMLLMWFGGDASKQQKEIVFNTMFCLSLLFFCYLTTTFDKGIKNEH